MRSFIFFSFLATVVACTAQEPSANALIMVERPNFILIFADDLGYGDLGAFGSVIHRTPHLDRMASEGMRMTSFYSTSGVCTPSRASLMTGSYPRRVNLDVNAKPYGEDGRQVLFPVAHRGLHPDEITVAEVLKDRGYATAIVGKWHLGDQPAFLPTRQGFDQYFGIPYSNDMDRTHVPLPLMRGDRVVALRPNQDSLTQRYTDEAISFIEHHQDTSFFLFMPHAMPHNPTAASERFRGKSKNGRYGDSIEELDASVGAILSTLERLDLGQRTLVFFTSDNGAAARWGGSNAPLRGFKGSTMEGGQRVPAIAWWPGQIPAGSTTDEVTSTMDLLPTFAGFAGGTIPTDRILDGFDIRPLLLGETHARSPYQTFFYYYKDQLQAVREGNWKLHLPLESKYTQIHRHAVAPSGMLLIDLSNDISENTNLAKQHPEVVDRLMAIADSARADLGEYDQPGRRQRKPGYVEAPQPLLMNTAQDERIE